jgi:signal transduction histidine kinase
MEQLKRMYGKQLPFIPMVGLRDKRVEMSEDEKIEVSDFVTTAVEQSMRGSQCDLDVAAKQIKDKMDGRYGPTWQVILGNIF